MNSKSPCTQLCQMNEKTGLCDGCFRTIEEVISWSSLRDSERIRINLEVRERRAKHEKQSESAQSSNVDF